MKKFTAAFTAVLLVIASAITVFAAGINTNEQAILDELKTTVSMQGSTLSVPSSYINQAEAYFNTVDVTKAQADEIIAVIKEGKTYLEQSGASNILDLTFDQKQVLLGYGQKAVGVLGMTMSYDKSAKTVTITSADGTVAFTGVASLSSNGTVDQQDVIKVTGSGANTAVAVSVGTALVLFVVFAGIYLVKTKKSAA